MGSDHPRSRGEYAGEVACQSFDLGSSPLSRGIHDIIHIPQGGVRIIPALAGNTRFALQC